MWSRPLFFVLILFFWAPASGEEKCFITETQIIHFGTKEITREPICIEEKENGLPLIISLNCRDHACEVFKLKKRFLQRREFFSQTGSPGFHLCYTLGGKPEMFEYKDNGVWHKTSRCFFGDSFIDIPSLYSLWEAHIF